MLSQQLGSKKLFLKSFFIFYLSFVSVRCQRNNLVVHSLRRRDINLSTLRDDYSSFLRLVNPIAVVRVSGTRENQQVRQYLIDKMNSYGWQTELDEFTDMTPYGTKSFANVIATLPAGPSFRQNEPIESIPIKNRIILACHYDSKYYADFEFIGAIDSAVPCAMLLDLAKYLHENFNQNDLARLNRHLQFVFFDGEEAFVEWTRTDSIYGARNYARALKQNYRNKQALNTIDLFVLLDLLGGDVSQFYNYFPESTGNAYKQLFRIEKMLRKANMLSKREPYYFNDLAGNGRFHQIEDDHIPFLNEGVPVLHLIPAPFPSVWHNERDTLANLNVNHVQDMRLILKVFLTEILNIIEPKKDKQEL